MSLATLMTDTVAILTAPTSTDRYGDEELDWANATTTSTTGWLARVDGSEVIDGRDALVSGWLLYLPAGTTIDGRDRVTIAGTTYELDGPPVHANVPGAGEHHLEARLRLVEG